MTFGTFLRIAGVVAVCAAMLGTACACSSVAETPSDNAVITEAADTVAAARGLVGRLFPKRGDAFVFESIPTDEGRDVFEVESRDVFDGESRDRRIVVRGNSGVSIAAGLNWYLSQRCRCNMSWCGENLNLPAALPEVKPKVRRTSWAKRRYFLNYCCFGYSLPWYDWEQWERLIDWMALHGVNMPLSVTGQEAVWQGVGRRIDMSEAEIEAFLAGPPYLPFQWMGCLDGWGGPLPKSWIGRHEKLQKKILARQRELGMTPVLQGFTGHVPEAIRKKYPNAKLHKIRWQEWETHLLDPLDPHFAEIAKIFLEEQTKRYGTAHLYAADPFIEMIPPSGDEKYLANLSRAIYAGMAKSDPKAIWVLQGWAFMYKRTFWTQPRFRAFLDAVDDRRMLLLDLYCEQTPMWNQTEAFCGKPWLRCNIQSFGGAVHLGGNLDGNNAGLWAARRDPKCGRLVGLGFVNEALDVNPVVYDLMFEAAWRDAPVDLGAWIVDYAHRRYGRENADAEAAWRLLRETVYQSARRMRSAIDRRPTLRPIGDAPYDNARLAEAWGRLLLAADECGDVDAYRFDLVNVARQTLSNHAAALQRKVVKAHGAGDAKAMRAAADEFLQLLLDMDELLATRREFLLGRWIADARRWGDTDAERARLEWNARRVLTCWGSGGHTLDYARKEWSGMISDFYHERWRRRLDAEIAAISEKRPLDVKALDKELRQWDLDWSARRDALPTEPRGDAVTLARRLWKKYGPAFEQ